MRLHVQALGEGRPLLILHGLLGSLDHWRSMTRRLASVRRVISVDLRNHGNSPHSAVMDYLLMADDIQEVCASENLRETAVLGHSMGGKVAMQFAARHADQLEKLIVVDIGPKSYPPTHRTLLTAMQQLDLHRYRSFAEIDHALAPAIGDPAVRQLVLKNLVRHGSAFRWRIGLDAISSNYDTLTKGIDLPKPFSKPACFIRGELSSFIQDEDLPAIRACFPNAEFRLITGAGHWIHADAPDAFYAAVVEFLAS